MEMKIREFSEVDGRTWDAWAAQMKDSSYLHSHAFLSFLHALAGPENTLTFACVGEDGQPVALCPLGICRKSVAGVDFVEASWNGAPLGLPVCSGDTPSARRKIQNEVLAVFHARLRAHSVGRACLRRHAITTQVLSGSGQDSMQLGLLQNGYECQPQNTVILDLRSPEDALLAQTSTYQRKHIRRSLRSGLRIREFGAGDPGLKEAFARYQEAHIASAGGLARPQRTFDIMLSLIEQGAARLFVAFAGDLAISYLHCGEFSRFAYGFSQVNLDEFERQHSPRQLLEWQAMLSYRNRGFWFYEVGTLWHGPQFYKVPSAKELSIAEFKRRYGGLWLPELCFERIFDRALWETIHDHRKKLFLSSDYFSAGGFPNPTNEEPR